MRVPQQRSNLMLVIDPVLRIYLRRSKGDGDHQQFSLDVQREGARMFVESMGLDWSKRVEYVDDDRAGDDFLGRDGLARLLRDVRPGDVIVCRDQHRLGREALQVTLAVQELVGTKRARLFYYSTREEVAFQTAIDSAMTFIRGVGAQMELEAIRSRTREALRSRVRAGRIAGGRCYGYALVRETDPTGRKYTRAVIDPEESKIVIRIFDDYMSGGTRKGICRRLNAERIPSPKAGRRGTGSWDPSAITTILRNERYRGIYTHGKISRRRIGGKRISEQANAADVMRVEIPEWRIVSDDVWYAAQERVRKQRAEIKDGRRDVRARYLLTTLGRCTECGGPIGIAYTKRGTVNMKAYVCNYHFRRGPEACPVTIRQPLHEVEGPIVAWLQQHVLTDRFLDVAFQAIRDEIKRHKKPTPKPDHIETELRRVRAEQERLAAAVASGGESIPELVEQLRRRAERIRTLEAELAAAKRTPAMVGEIMAKVEASARAKLRDLKTSLANPEQAREALQAILPEGVTFTPVYYDEDDRPASSARGGRPRVGVWRVKGKVEMQGVLTPSEATPAGFEPALPT